MDTTTTTRKRRQRHPITLCLAHASPEVAPVSWLAVNALCLTCSLVLAVGNLLVNLQPKTGQQQQQQAVADEEELFESPAVQVTIEYLVWSLVTTIVWIVEVALRTSFPPETLADLNDDDEVLIAENDGSGNVESDQVAYRIQPDDDNNDKNDFVGEDDQTEKTLTQQKLQTRVLFVELILALFFLVESILDCLHWRARVEKGDFTQQEVDIWINIFAYVYMTYETYKTASANKQLTIVQRWGSCFWCTKTKTTTSLKDSLMHTTKPPSTENSSQATNADTVPKLYDLG